MCVRLCAERLNLRHLRHTHAELPVLQLEHHLHRLRQHELRSERRSMPALQHSSLQLPDLHLGFGLHRLH